MHDPDAPLKGGWYHWVVFNLPATTQQLPAGTTLAQTQLGETSFDENTYGGPCPPPGKPHHYVFTLYALDVQTIADAPMTGPALEAAIAHHTLAKTTLTGLYQTP